MRTEKRHPKTILEEDATDRIDLMYNFFRRPSDQAPNLSFKRTGLRQAAKVKHSTAQSALSMDHLLQELQTLEVELHHPGVRCSRERLEELLHPEFHEIGRSGRAYSRETIVNFLAAQESQPVVVSEAFSVSELSPGVALLNYRSAHVLQGKSLVKHTLRSSVWIQTNAGWQLRYHQGTAAAESW